MAKILTSKKPEKYSKAKSKVSQARKPRLKVSSQTFEYSAVGKLLDRKFISNAIADALIDGDTKAIREILHAHLSLVHKESFHKIAGISRRALFKLMQPDANPTIESLAKICKALVKVA